MASPHTPHKPGRIWYILVEQPVCHSSYFCPRIQISFHSLVWRFFRLTSTIFPGLSRTRFLKLIQRPHYHRDMASQLAAGLAIRPPSNHLR